VEILLFKSIKIHLISISLETHLAKFWTIKETTVDGTKSTENRRTYCETHFAKTISRNANDRYVVCLSFCANKANREVSRLNICLLWSASSMVTQYSKANIRTFEEYVNAKHVSVDDGYYMPHAVFKESNDTFKIQIIFNSSAKK